MPYVEDVSVVCLSVFFDTILAHMHLDIVLLNSKYETFTESCLAFQVSSLTRPTMNRDENENM
jgi:hypothetical protein